MKKIQYLKDTSKNISDFNIKGLVVLDRRHHWGHKLQENNQRHMRFYFFAFRFGLLNESLHHFWMLTRVDCQHPEIQLRHQFLSDCFILVLGINVLEDLLRTQRSSIDIITFDPKSWSVVVFVICDVNTVTAIILFSGFNVVTLDIQETIFFCLLDLFWGKFPNSKLRGSRGHEELFIRIVQKLVLFTYRFLPLPAEVSDLIASLNKLLRRKNSSVLEIFLRRSKFRVHEIFKRSQHIVL